ncbi:MAG: hypothetical protein AVDCRST_MAG16-45, partial [uncultured Frankineae bacterium]
EGRLVPHLRPRGRAGLHARRARPCRGAPGPGPHQLRARRPSRPRLGPHRRHHRPDGPTPAAGIPRRTARDGAVVLVLHRPRAGAGRARRAGPAAGSGAARRRRRGLRARRRPHPRHPRRRGALPAGALPQRLPLHRSHLARGRRAAPGLGACPPPRGPRRRPRRRPARRLPRRPAARHRRGDPHPDRAVRRGRGLGVDGGGGPDPRCVRGRPGPRRSRDRRGLAVRGAGQPPSSPGADRARRSDRSGVAHAGPADPHRPQRPGPAARPVL